MDDDTADVSLEPQNASTAAGDAPCVFFDRQTIADMNAHAAEEADHEIAGILIGSVVEGDRPVVMVEASIRGKHLTYTRGSVTFTHETWNDLNRIKDEQYPDKRVVGWYHSHPGFGIFLSSYDLFIHRSFFTAPWQVAYVTDPKARTYGCFTWQSGDLAQDHALQVSAPAEQRYQVVEPVPTAAAVPVVNIAAPAQANMRDQGMMLALWFLSGLVGLLLVLSVSSYYAQARIVAQFGVLQAQITTLQADRSPAARAAEQTSPPPPKQSEATEPSPEAATPSPAAEGNKSGADARSPGS